MKNSNIEIVDFHSHTLPCIDHGSLSVQTSIAQLNLASAHGVSRVLATPHFYPHVHNLSDFLESRKRSVEMLFDAKDKFSTELKVASEVLLCSGLENMKGLETLCLFGTEYILLELPFNDFRNDYLTTVRRLMISGYKIILAHADRYDQDDIERLLDVGVYMIQLNAESLVGFRTRKCITGWLNAGVVTCIGSDIHGIDSKAYQRFIKAKSKLSNHISIIKEKSDAIWDKIADFV